MIYCCSFKVENAKIVKYFQFPLFGFYFLMACLSDFFVYLQREIGIESN